MGKEGREGEEKREEKGGEKGEENVREVHIEIPLLHIARLVFSSLLLTLQPSPFLSRNRHLKRTTSRKTN